MGRTTLEAMAQGIGHSQAPGCHGGETATAERRLQAKGRTLEQALHSWTEPHPRRTPAIPLAHIGTLDRVINRLHQEIDARMWPFDQALGRLDAIPISAGRRRIYQLVNWGGLFCPAV